MILKTRKALPKFRLFRKFKVDFFNVFSKGARISRKYLHFYIRRHRRYKFWHARNIKSYSFNKFYINRWIGSLYSKWPLILERFSLFRNNIRRKHKFLINRLLKSIIVSNSIRATISTKIMSTVITPTDYRFNVLYNLKSR